MKMIKFFDKLANSNITLAKVICGWLIFFAVEIYCKIGLQSPMAFGLVKLAVDIPILVLACGFLLLDKNEMENPKMKKIFKYFFWSYVAFFFSVIAYTGCYNVFHDYIPSPAPLLIRYADNIPYTLFLVFASMGMSVLMWTKDKFKFYKENVFNISAIAIGSTGLILGSSMYGHLHTGDLPLTVMNYMQIVMQAYVCIMCGVFLLIQRHSTKLQHSFMTTLIVAYLIIAGLNILGHLEIMHFSATQLLEDAWDLGMALAAFGAYTVYKKKILQLPESNVLID